jgi:hypothetical protein
MASVIGLFTHQSLITNKCSFFPQRIYITKNIQVNKYGTNAMLSLVKNGKDWPEPDGTDLACIKILK